MDENINKPGLGLEMEEDRGSIEKYRKLIDRIDLELLELLNRRADTALSIGKIKKQNKQPVYVPEREREIIERLISLNNGPLSKEAIKKMFLNIFDQMKFIENDLDEKN